MTAFRTVSTMLPARTGPVGSTMPWRTDLQKLLGSPDDGERWVPGPTVGHMKSVDEPPVRARRKRLCPVCRSEAWRIAYGMILPDQQEKMPKTVFAGCCIDMRERLNPKTGEREFGTPSWECQNPECRHQWW